MYSSCQSVDWTIDIHEWPIFVLTSPHPFNNVFFADQPTIDAKKHSEMWSPSLSGNASFDLSTSVDGFKGKSKRNRYRCYGFSCRCSTNWFLTVCVCVEEYDIVWKTQTSETPKTDSKWPTKWYLCGLWTATCPCCTLPVQVRDNLQTLNITHAPFKFGKFTIQQRLNLKQRLLKVKWITYIILLWIGFTTFQQSLQGVAPQL